MVDGRTRVPECRRLQCLRVPRNAPIWASAIGSADNSNTDTRLTGAHQKRLIILMDGYAMTISSHRR
jgi:hypothetical protein